MKIIVTADGSHSVHSEKFDATYHSSHGAIAESKHVFIKQGFLKFTETQNPERINVFEMGFGTGLNAFLTLLEAKACNLKVNYTAVEEYPLPETVYSSLNYAEQLGEKDKQSIFMRMHQCDWNSFCTISPEFTLRKLNTKLENMIADTTYHLVYYDAFAFTAQPELWTEDIFSKLFAIMENGGILVTYSAKGQVRRNLEAVGFDVERVEGPPGKREMLRAIKPLSLHA